MRIALNSLLSTKSFQNSKKGKVMDLRTETTTRKFREEMKKQLGNECCNCGCTENIEYHHVVPIFLGGTNRITNIVPLCHKCHKAAHMGGHLTQYSDKSNSGRKSMADDDRAYKIFDMFKNGEIGTLKCKELLGYSRRTQINDRPQYKRYLNARGITKIRNNIDVVATNSRGGLVEGKEVGYIIHENGKKENMFFHDTGKNDVEYTRRDT